MDHSKSVLYDDEREGDETMTDGTDDNVDVTTEAAEGISPPNIRSVFR